MDKQKIICDVFFCIKYCNNKKMDEVVSKIDWF